MPGIHFDQPRNRKPEDTFRWLNSDLVPEFNMHILRREYRYLRRKGLAPIDVRCALSGAYLAGWVAGRESFRLS